MARTPSKKNFATTEIAILAGGLSTRMGRDKARLRLGRRTLLGHVRAAALATKLPVRVIRRDRVPRCGPLGGIYTALNSARADVTLFLPCDQPFLTADFLGWFLRSCQRMKRAVFCDEGGTAGFPCAIRRDALEIVTAQIKRRDFSLQALAAALKARRLRVPGRFTGQRFNVNTPSDWAQARRRWKTRVRGEALPRQKTLD